MAALRSNLRRLGLAVTLAASSTGCAADPTELPDELRGDPYCALIIGTHGYFEDGDRLLIVDYEDGHVAAGCICAEDEDEVFSGALDDEINAASLEECRRQAATQDFVSDECEDDYASGEWMDLIVKAEDDYAWLDPELRCFGS